MRRDDSYRGFETWFNDFKMRLKMYWVLSLILGTIQLLLFGILARVLLGELDTQIFWNWVVAKIWTLWQPTHSMTFEYAGSPYRMTARELALYLQPYMARYLAQLAALFLGTCSVYLAVPLLVRWFRRRAGIQAGPEFVRGSRFVDPETFQRTLRKAGVAVDLPLGQIRLPVAAEVKHVFTVGRPGVGKTVLLNQVIERLMVGAGRSGGDLRLQGGLHVPFLRPEAGRSLQPPGRALCGVEPVQRHRNPDGCGRPGSKLDPL